MRLCKKRRSREATVFGFTELRLARDHSRRVPAAERDLALYVHAVAFGIGRQAHPVPRAVALEASGNDVCRLIAASIDSSMEMFSRATKLAWAGLTLRQHPEVAVVASPSLPLES